MDNAKNRAMEAHKSDNKIPFDRLTEHDIKILYACADRVFAVVNDYLKQYGNGQDRLLERDLVMLRMDIAVAKLSRGLDLYAFLLSDDLTFFTEWVTIQKNVDRTCGRIPDHVALRFSSIGESVKIITH